MSIPTPATKIVIRLTWLEFIRRKDFYVVAIFMGLFVLAMVAVRLIGIENATTARFLMSLGLSFSHGLAACLAVSFGARAMPEEFERGTLLPLLAKPVSRTEVLAGKILACLGLVLGSYLLFVVMTILAVPRVEGQQLGALAQVLCLGMTGLVLLTAMAFTLSLHAPVVVAALVSLGWYFCSGFVVQIVGESARMKSAATGAVVERLLALLPETSTLQHVEVFASSSTTLAAGDFLLFLAYGIVWVGILLTWGSLRFSRMALS